MRKILSVELSALSFSLPLNYNNVYARLRYVAGTKSSIWADLQIRSHDVSWYTDREDLLMPLSSVPTVLYEELRQELERQLLQVKTILERDEALKKYVNDILCYPSEDYVFYYQKPDNTFCFVIAGWGCRLGIVRQEANTSSDSSGEVDSFSEGYSQNVQGEPDNSESQPYAKVPSPKRGKKLLWVILVSLFILSAVAFGYFYWACGVNSSNGLSEGMSAPLDEGDDNHVDDSFEDYIHISYDSLQQGHELIDESLFPFPEELKENRITTLQDYKKIRIVPGRYETYAGATPEERKKALIEVFEQCRQGIVPTSFQYLTEKEKFFLQDLFDCYQDCMSLGVDQLFVDNLLKRCNSFKHIVIICEYYKEEAWYINAQTTDSN